MSTKKELVEVGDGFWNIRGHFVILKFIDIGNHMSIARLSNGKFLVIDAIPLTDQIKQEINELTGNGANIAAVVATHPFHTLALPSFYEAYPNPPYYGTPRHLRKLTTIKWAGDLNDCSTRGLWAPDVEMRIPAGAEFVAPLPEKSNHFSSVWVFHKASRTMHVDDTIFYTENPGFLLKLGGFKPKQMTFHISIKGPGLHQHPEAPFQFRDFVTEVLKDWDFDNIVMAHTGNKIGGAKQQLEETLKGAEKLFKTLSEKKLAKLGYKDEDITSISNEQNECG